MTILDELALVLARSNGTEWDFFPGGADDKDPYYRDAAAVLEWLTSNGYLDTVQA